MIRHIYFTILLSLLIFTRPALGEEKPWQTLISGDTLTGWTSLTGAEPGKGWSISQGVLHLKGGAGGSIISKNQYENFELEWTWKVEEGGNNGLKYWVTQMPDQQWLGIEYQMIDDLRHPDGKRGGNHNTASFYDLKAASADKILNPAGEWNDSRVIVKDGKIQHFLNGKLACEVDTKSPEWKKMVEQSKFSKNQGFAPGHGFIMLTDHQNQAWYKNLRIRPL